MDPITPEIISNSLCSIAEEMGEVLAARALSPGINQRRNFSTAVYNTAGLLTALGDHVPVHLGPLRSLAQAVLEVHPLHSLSQGDSIITSDPYTCGLLPTWVFLISPVYHNHTPLALVASIAGHSDAGGVAPGGIPTASVEIFHEGVRIPPVKIAKRGELDNGLLSLISSNLRTPRHFAEDLKAQLSAAKIGGRRMAGLVEKYGQEKIKRCMTEIMNRTEARARESFFMLPGACAFEDFIEDSDSKASININLTVSKNDEYLTFDFTGTHPQVECPLNAPSDLALSAVYYAARTAFCPELPVNDGFFRTIRVITPKGSLLNPVFPAPVALAGVNTVQRITDTVFGCLAWAIPDKTEAAGTGSAFSFTAGGTTSSGEGYFCFAETHGGGQGAGAHGDGMDGAAAGITNVMSTPVEILEREFPIIVNSSALIADSGGPGKFRGGTGIRRSYTLLRRSAVTIGADRVTRGPWGLSGGLPGRAANISIEKSSESDQITAGKFSGILEEGSSVIIETAGGGGCGPPLERSPDAVRNDVLEGHVSREQAEGVYGVILSGPDLRVDYRATEERRVGLTNNNSEKLWRRNPRIQKPE